MANRLRSPDRGKLVVSLIVAGILFQTILLAIPTMRDLLRLPGVIGQHALWRSAYFFQGQRFAEFIGFLNETIPEQARVVLPPTSGGEKILGTTPYMQFYLAPRLVVNCPDPNCLGGISPHNTYVLVVDPSQVETLNNFDRLQMYDQQWGVASNLDTANRSTTRVRAFQSFWQIIGATLLPLVWLITLTCIGLCLVGFALPDQPVFAQAALSFGVGLTSLTISISLAMLLGVSLDARLILGITALLIVVAAITRLGSHYKPTDNPATPPDWKLNLSDHLWLVSLVALSSLAASISVGKSFHTTDAILLWGAKGYGLASTGILESVVNWGTNTVPYPLHIPLLVASFKTLYMDSLPASKFVFPGYYLSVGMIIYQALLQANLKRTFARLVTLLLASTPLLFRHATIGYANLALSFNLIAGAVLLQQALNHLAENDNMKIPLMSGIFFAAAAWSRPEGLPLSWAAIALALTINLLRRSNMKALRKIAFLSFPVMLYTGYWYLLNSQIYGPAGLTNDLMGKGVSQVLSGNLHIGEAGFLARNFIERLANVKTWGVLGILLLVSLPFSLLKSNGHGRTGSLFFYLGLLWIMMILGMYFLASYDPKHDISWWVSTGLDRMLIPGVLLSLVGSLSLIDLLNNREESASTTHPK